jgi:hypothetical protein
MSDSYEGFIHLSFDKMMIKQKSRAAPFKEIAIGLPYSRITDLR